LAKEGQTSKESLIHAKEEGEAAAKERSTNKQNKKNKTIKRSDGKKPAMAIFKAIFEDSDESGEEDSSEKEEEEEEGASAKERKSEDNFN